MKKAIEAIFIGGCERSGTTLLGSMIGNNSETICVPEAKFIIELAKRYGGDLSGEYALEELVTRVESIPRFATWDIEIDQIIKAGEKVNLSKFVIMLVELYAKKKGKKEYRRWVDQTPWNVRYGMTLERLFPRAKYIHMVRDGRAVAASLLSADWGVRTVKAAADRWVSQLSYGLALEQVMKTRCLRVRYEDLVASPSKTMEKVCAFADLELEENMMDSRGAVPPSLTREDHRLIGGPIDVGRIDGWKGVLSDRDINSFESRTCDLLEMLGYESLFGVSAIPSTGLRRLLGDTEEFLFREVIYRYKNHSKLRKLKKAL